ncbi:MAG TPA: glycosyltransferase family 4 protein [Bacteroidia bacterium]|jgi:glycosyltransferase involved in cell wall biosynthesis|nr:glycosyltransferase family 4 protein [Bacteroidia bacterium]
MRVGIITAHYMPEVGYQEVHLPKAFARNGHTVKVFTSNASVDLGGEMNKLTYKSGLFKDEKYGFEILRLPAISYKSKAYSFGLRKAVEEFKPDVLVVLGVAKIFPLPLLNAAFGKKVKMVSIYGDAKEYLDRNTFKQKFKTSLFELGYRFIKEPLYRRAVRYGERLVMNIPETNDFFLDFLKGDDKKIFEQKRLMLTLGFNPDEYFYNETDRLSKRKELGISDDEVVLITSTRVNKRKNLEGNIELVSRLRAEGKKLKYIIVGFLGDAYERELKAFTLSQPEPEAFICFPFLNAEEIRKMYCAADVGIWIKVAISIQEAMGTGLPIILENKPSVNHLLKNEVNGWFYKKDNFESVIKKAVSILQDKKMDREKLARENEATLSYDTIAQKIIENLN